MANETKVGLLAVISILILIWGYNFLKGKDIFSSSLDAYIEYEDIGGLEISSPVLLNGFKVGMVKDIYLKADNTGKIIVELAMNGDLKIPKSTNVLISSNGVMGGKSIILKYEGACAGSDCLQSGDQMNGGTLGMIEAMAGENYDQIMDIITKIDTTVRGFSSGEGGKEIEQSMADIQEIIANLKVTTAQLNMLMSASTSKITGILTNFESVTNNLAQSNSKINQVLNSTASFTKKLEGLNLEGTINGANDAVATTKVTVEKLQTTLKTADQAMLDISKMMKDINSTDGTLGLLIHDPVLYNNLNKTSRDLDLLLQDVRLNPKRYTRVLSRKQIDYVIPEKDPANPQ